MAEDAKSELGNKLAELAAALANVEKGVSDDQLAAAFAGPAILATRFYGNLAPGGIRIAFCEDIGVPRKSIYRTAVFLPTADAKALKNLLEEMLGDLEAKDGGSTQRSG